MNNLAISKSNGVTTSRINMELKQKVATKSLLVRRGQKADYFEQHNLPQRRQVEVQIQLQC